MPGCGKGPQTSAVEAEKEIRAQQGWTFLETFGQSNADAEMAAYMDSKTADKLTAFASTNGIQASRDYVQTDKLYLVVSMQRTNGDGFSLIFTKPMLTTTTP